MTKVRPFSAESLTLGTAILTTGGVALEIIPPQRGLLFIIGMIAGGAFHIISNRTLDESGTESAQTQDEVRKTSGSITATETEEDPGHSFYSYTDDDPDRSDESASTRSVSGSTSGGRGHRRNSDRR